MTITLNENIMGKLKKKTKTPKTNKPTMNN